MLLLFSGWGGEGGVRCEYCGCTSYFFCFLLRAIFHCFPVYECFRSTHTHLYIYCIRSILLIAYTEGPCLPLGIACRPPLTRKREGEKYHGSVSAICSCYPLPGLSTDNGAMIGLLSTLQGRHPRAVLLLPTGVRVLLDFTQN